MRSKTFLLLGWAFLAAQSAAAECFRAPADPSDCRLVDIAHTRMVAATDALRASFLASDGQYDPAITGCLSSAMSYLASCEKSACSTYDFAVKKNLSFGWGEEQTARFVSGPSGSCRLSEAKSTGDTNLIAPGGVTVLHSVQSQDPGSHRLYMMSANWQCSAPDTQTTRNMTFTESGVMAIDWTDRDPVSLHWGKRVLTEPKGDPRVDAQDASTLRLQWPNGGLIDFGTDGKMKASNFLSPSDWDPKRCRTQILPDHRHYAPALEVVADQQLARLAPDFVKH